MMTWLCWNIINKNNFIVQSRWRKIQFGRESIAVWSLLRFSFLLSYSAILLLIISPQVLCTRCLHSVHSFTLLPHLLITPPHFLELFSQVPLYLSLGPLVLWVPLATCSSPYRESCGRPFWFFSVFILVICWSSQHKHVLTSNYS